MYMADSLRRTMVNIAPLEHLSDARLRALGRILTVVGGPGVSRMVDVIGQSMDQYGLRNVTYLLPVFDAADRYGYIPPGQLDEMGLFYALERFRQADMPLFDGKVLEARHHLAWQSDASARALAYMDRIITRSAPVSVDEEETGPLADLADFTGMSVDTLARLFTEVQADGLDPATATDVGVLTALFTAHQARDPYLWEGLRLATRHDVNEASDAEARVLARIDEIAGTATPSRLWAHGPLPTLARAMGLDHSVDRLVGLVVEAQARGLDLAAIDDARQLAAALTALRGPVPAPDMRDEPQTGTDLHDLSPDARNVARNEAQWRLAEAQRQADASAGSSDLWHNLAANLAREQAVSLAARIKSWMRWPNRPEVSYTGDFAAFRRDHEAVFDRTRGGEPAIPYMIDDVTSGLATRESGRGFGLEIEFDLSSVVDHHNARLAIARALHEAGLSADPLVYNYHDSRVGGYHAEGPGGMGGWRLELDSSVAGELVSPILYDEPETWHNLSVACEIIRAHGGVANINTGGHIHVGIGDYDHLVENYNTLLTFADHHADTLFRLAQNPEQGRQRGVAYARPNMVPSDEYREVEDATTDNRDHRAVDLGYAHGDPETRHVEFRLWDGSLDPATIQTRVKISVAITEAALRYADLSARPNGGDHDPLGVHRIRHDTDPEPDAGPRGSRSFRRLVDEIFWRAVDKQQALALFAVTRWPKYGR
jgi:hypothetical protein